VRNRQEPLASTGMFNQSDIVQPLQNAERKQRRALKFPRHIQQICHPRVPPVIEVLPRTKYYGLLKPSPIIPGQVVLPLGEIGRKKPIQIHMWREKKFVKYLKRLSNIAGRQIAQHPIRILLPREDILKHTKQLYRLSHLDLDSTNRRDGGCLATQLH